MVKKGFAGNIEEKTKKNTAYRKVLFTGKSHQLVLMSLKPGENIGEETHNDVDQFFRFEKGIGVVVIDGRRHKVKNGIAIIVPMGARHNVINTSNDLPLKFYTLYSKPEHKDKLIQRRKKNRDIKF